MALSDGDKVKVKYNTTGGFPKREVKAGTAGKLVSHSFIRNKGSIEFEQHGVKFQVRDIPLGDIEKA